MANEVTSILFPVGRLVAGIVGESQLITDMATKQPKLDEQGQQQFEYFIAVAIPKSGPQEKWWETQWGQAIYQKAWADWPNGQPGQQGFAWKITNGDSTTPNRANNIPAQQPGYAGHWVVHFKTRFSPQFVNANGTQAVAPDTFYRGCYVQVHASCRGNGTQGNPGVFLNHDIVAFSGHGERINTGPDASQVGFGQGPLPQGASQTPLSQPITQHTPAPSQQPAPPTQGAAAAGQPPAGYGGPHAPAGSPQHQYAPPQGAPQYAPPGGQAHAPATPSAGSPSEPYYGAMTPPPAQ
jgi:hypothetical protein